jgi:hypothetical protein
VAGLEFRTLDIAAELACSKSCYLSKRFSPFGL